jgi:hypothetical protein
MSGKLHARLAARSASTMPTSPKRRATPAPETPSPRSSNRQRDNDVRASPDDTPLQPGEAVRIPGLAVALKRAIDNARTAAPTAPARPEESARHTRAGSADPANSGTSPAGPQHARWTA